MEISAIRELCRGYLAGTLSAPELRQFLDYLWEDSNHEIFVEEMHMILRQEQYAQRIDEGKVEVMLQNVLSRARPRRRRIFLRYAAAAAVLAILLGTGAYFWFQDRPSKPLIVSGHDIVPGSNKAILTLADGSRVALDSTGNQVILQGSTVIHQQGGSLQYDVKDAPEIVRYNTLSTPRGGQFQVQLPDGTKVWLNAASSIRYPTVFAGKERRVEVTGEAYFEVAKNTEIPFRVNVNNKAEIEVLGTHFNVNAYENEKTLNTTLVEGSVKVNGMIIKPGQQAQVGDAVRIIDDTDLGKVTAWKNGLFNFDGAGLEEVMRQLERWYDIDVVYEKGVPDIRFVGKMKKNIPLKDLLEILEKTRVHFRLEKERRLVVMP